MKRISYELLAYQVDKLYAVEFSDDDEDAIIKHCEYIAEFIKACGWQEEEYMDEFIHRATIEEFNN